MCDVVAIESGALHADHNTRHMRDINLHMREIHECAQNRFAVCVCELLLLLRVLLCDGPIWDCYYMLYCIVHECVVCGVLENGQ